jgi:hypothetical protein
MCCSQPPQPLYCTTAYYNENGIRKKNHKSGKQQEKKKHYATSPIPTSLEPEMCSSKTQPQVQTPKLRQAKISHSHN